MIGRLVRRPMTWVVVVILAAGGALGLFWFQPWKLVVDQRVDERLSDAAPAAGPSADPTDDGSTADGPTDDPTGEPTDGAATEPVLLAEGDFVTHEHATTGTARIVRNPDGSHQLELADLDTSNGPDLRVWLTDQPVIDGRDGWHVFDDGAWVELGPLKGNQGNQVYDIPADVDLADYRSVSVWCRRFAVSFGAAEVVTG
jgi:hypothetical protein